MTRVELRAAGQRLFPELNGLEPSPLERWSLPAGWPIGEIWVKRDDRLGQGGSKVRKLSVALSRAKVAGAGLLTIGHLDSNHALATARLGRRLGVPVELALLGKADTDPGRAALMRAVAPARFYGTTAGLVVGSALRLARGDLRLLPPGGTTALTTAALALAVGELCDQFWVAGEPVPDRWAVAVGSGGTLAGLWAGVRALGLSVRPYGASASTRWVGPHRVARLANQALALLGGTARVEAREIEVDPVTLGAGHAKPTPDSTDAMAAFAGDRALDPIFTAKAMAGLRARARPGERWLFWHTGLTVS